MKHPVWEEWHELRGRADDADIEAWAKIMPLWPEVTSGDVEPLFRSAYGFVMERLAAHWAAVNHPEPTVRRVVLKLADESDPHHATRGTPAARHAEVVSVKDWRPSPVALHARVEATVTAILDGFFAALARRYRVAGDQPVQIAHYRPCVKSFFIHWLGMNYPDKEAVQALKERYIREDPLFMERCGATP